MKFFKFKHKKLFIVIAIAVLCLVAIVYLQWPTLKSQTVKFIPQELPVPYNPVNNFDYSSWDVKTNGGLAILGDKIYLINSKTGFIYEVAGNQLIERYYNGRFDTWGVRSDHELWIVNDNLPDMSLAKIFDSDTNNSNDNTLIDLRAWREFLKLPTLDIQLVSNSLILNHMLFLNLFSLGDFTQPRWPDNFSLHSYHWLDHEQCYQTNERDHLFVITSCLTGSDLGFIDDLNVTNDQLKTVKDPVLLYWNKKDPSIMLRFNDMQGNSQYLDIRYPDNGQKQLDLGDNTKFIDAKINDGVLYIMELRDDKNVFLVTKPLYLL